MPGKNSFVVTACALLLSGFSAFAEDYLTVAWIQKRELPGGRYQIYVPDQNYLQQMRACGIQIDLNRRENYVTFAQLSCPGLLDFSQSEQLFARVRADLKKLLGREIPEVRFALSKEAVFISLLDQNQKGRMLAVNVAKLRLVILNKVIWDKLETTDAQYHMLVHETLGALGIDDSDFQVSSALAVNRGHGMAISPKIRKDTGANKKYAGVSIAGRGGDSTAAYFKQSLLVATQKPIEVTDASGKKFPAPDIQKVRALIQATPVSVASKDFLMQHDLCQSSDKKEVSEIHCGGFNLHGHGNKPFLVITEKWGTFGEAHNYKLLLKIYLAIVTSLVCEEKGSCGK